MRSRNMDRAKFEFFLAAKLYQVYFLPNSIMDARCHGIAPGQLPEQVYDIERQNSRTLAYTYLESANCNPALKEELKRFVSDNRPIGCFPIMKERLDIVNQIVAREGTRRSML